MQFYQRHCMGTYRGTCNYTIVKYSSILLTCTLVHLFYKILQNELIPIMHHYLIYYLRKFLWILIFGYPASNIAINSSTPYHVSDLCVTPFSSQSPTNYGLRIIFLANSVGTTNSITIGHTSVLWLGTMVTGHTISITQIDPNKAHI